MTEPGCEMSMDPEYCAEQAAADAYAAVIGDAAARAAQNGEVAQSGRRTEMPRRMRLPDSMRDRIPALGTGNGVPLHAALTDVPVALFSLAPLFDLAAYARDSEWLGEVGRWDMALAAGWAVPTAVSGVLDYLKAPYGHPIKRVGMVHAALNTAVLGCGVASLALRGIRRRPTFPSLVLSFAAGAGVVASSHLGGIMVYRHGSRVLAAEPGQTMTETAPATEQAEPPLAA